MRIRLKRVNFGLSKTGLTTVGYTIYDDAGNELVARSASGVFEYGDTGIYAAKISLPERSEFTLIWDTGEASPRYAPDEDTAQLDIIQEETDRIRVIWNTLQNTGEAYAKLADKINKLKAPDNRKDFEDVVKEIKKIVIPVIPTVDEIKKALTVTVKAPDVQVKDYSDKIEKVRELVVALGVSFNRLPREYDSLASSISKIQSAVNIIYGGVNENKEGLRSTSSGILTLMKELKQELKDAQEALERSIVENTKIDKTVKDLVTANGIGKIIENMSDSNRQREQLRISLGIK